MQETLIRYRNPKDDVYLEGSLLKIAKRGRIFKDDVFIVAQHQSCTYGGVVVSETVKVKEIPSKYVIEIVYVGQSKKKVK